jgi:hypothetical protein
MPKTSVGERAAVGLTIVALAGLFSFRSVYEPDLWWHLAQGREALSGQLVWTNLFSFTYPDYRQPFTSWLFDAAIYVAYAGGGSVAIQTVQAGLIAAALGLSYLASRQRAPAAAAWTVMLLGALVLEPRAIPRPHVVSFAGMAACALIIERVLTRRRIAPLWWAIPLVVVWSNLHVEVAFGVALLGAFVACEWARPSALTRPEAARGMAIVALATLGTFCTPYGGGLWRYLYEGASLPALLSIAEIQPPYLPAYRAFFVFLAVGAMLLLSQPRRLTLWEVVCAVGFAAAGARFIRLTPLVVFVAAPMVAARLGALVARGVDDRAVVVTGLAAAIAICPAPIASYVRALEAGADAVEPASFFSRGAVAFARAEGLSGPFFNSNNLGGYFAWTLYPAARVFQDSRTEAYPPDHFRRILSAFQSQSEWDALVAGTGWAALSRPRPNALSGATRFPRRDWATVYWDDAVEIVVRRAGSHASVIERHEYRLVLPESDVFLLAAQLTGESRARLRAEAARNRADNPNGFLAMALMCLADDAASCAGLEELARRRPSLVEPVRRIERMRVGR